MFTVLSILPLIIFLNVLLNEYTYGRTNFIKDNITVTIPQGMLFGKESVNYWNSTFYSFEGIPFAKPQVGSLRFKAPEPAESWSGIYDATQIRPICPQFMKNSDVQSEDCLFVNVYSKMSKELKPVMVWIHGGGFIYGSIHDKRHGPELIMSEGIVLVKIAYRLNVFGFLNIDDPKYEIHGNAGLKDQVLGLKWIQENIRYFGGDPNQVTIFGVSAGAVSVHLLCLSPLGKGLFHRAIIQSGAVGNPWITSPYQYFEYAKYFSKKLKTPDDIVNYINGSTTIELLHDYFKVQKSDKFNKKFRTGEMSKFNNLVIEKENISNSFLTENPEDIVKNGKFNRVPTIMGFNTHESVMFIPANTVLPNVTDFRTLIPKDVNIDIESEEAYILGQKIKEFYYGDQTPSYDLMDPYIDYATDTLFLEKIYKFAKLQSSVAKDVPVYFYQFDYKTKLNLSQNKTKYVTHTDECYYLLQAKGHTPQNLDPNSDEYIGIHRMVKLWTTFAKSENADPNPIDDSLLNVKWLPIETDKFNYLKIAQNLELKQNPVKDRMHFWEEIYKTYNVNC